MKQTLISQDLDFQKSRCRLKGRVYEEGLFPMKMQQRTEKKKHYFLFFSKINNEKRNCFMKINLLAFGHLICTLISENQGLEKLRSVSNLRKISGPAHLDFFSVCHLDFFQVYGINLAFFSRWRPRKKSRFAGPEIFLRFEADLDFSRPWFSEIKVQMKRPIDISVHYFSRSRKVSFYPPTKNTAD